MIHTIGKRQFLRGMGAFLAAAGMGGWSRAAALSREWDVIVVGAGTAGLPAALFASARKASVLLIETSGHIGGTLERAGGQIAGAGTRFQAAKGIEDSPQAHFDDIMRITRRTADPKLVRLFVDNSGNTIDWLADHGFTIMPDQPVKGDAGEPFTTARYLWGPDHGRSILNVIRPLTERAIAAGEISLALRTGAVELIQERSGAVVGIITRGEDGVRIEHRGRNVVLTTGGCAANPRLFERLHGIPLYARWAYPYSQGDGITLGVSAGGFIRGAEKYLPDFGRVLSDNDYPSPVFASPAVDPKRRPPWEIFVNAAGSRFVREDHPSPDFREHALGRQANQRYYIVFDQAILDQAPPLLPTLDADKLQAAFDFHPMFAKASTLEALAARAGLNCAGLLAAVQGYNAGVAAKRDSFEREFLPLALTKPPFYAIEQQGVSLMSFAGLGVDEHLRVIRSDGRVIPNLYAAGEVLGAGAMSGNAHTSGMMAGGALTFGRLLGQTIIPLG